MKKLAKPSVPVWAANQLGRREPGEVQALLRSAEELRAAQRRALGGEGAADLRDRLADQRKAVRALAHLARDILADEGRAVSDAIVERIAKTLDAASLDEASRPRLASGRLTEELEPPGFDALASMAPTARRRQAAAAAAPSRAAAADARRRLQQAQREARSWAREAAQAEREAARAEAAAAEAREAAQAARERADEAEQALAEAEVALRDAQGG